MKKNNKRFSGISKLPNGNTSNKIVPGCIVLEGGAFRGLYTSGVLDALMQFEYAVYSRYKCRGTKRI